jgi:hypothetical protein
MGSKVWDGLGVSPMCAPGPEFWELLKKRKNMIKPTAKDVWMNDDEYESVHRDLDDSWRHGNYVYEVFHRESDDTYWAVNYQVSGDGEYNSLRDEPDFVEFDQVIPVKKMVEITEYELVKEGNDGKTSSST